MPDSYDLVETEDIQYADLHPEQQEFLHDMDEWCELIDKVQITSGMGDNSWPKLRIISEMASMDPDVINKSFERGFRCSSFGLLITSRGENPDRQQITLEIPQ